MPIFANLDVAPYGSSELNTPLWIFVNYGALVRYPVWVYPNF